MSKVLHVVTPKYEFLGKRNSEGKHSFGEGWIRLENACVVRYMQGKDGSTQIQLAKVEQNKNYRNYVDINMSHALSIQTVDEKGGLYKTYFKLISNLVLPGVGMN